jgi:hypothetical protein
MTLMTPPPTPEEFERARRRQLARLNLRMSSITGCTFHNPEDSELLEGDAVDQRRSDMDVVRRWTANPPRDTEVVKTSPVSTAIHRSS